MVLLKSRFTFKFSSSSCSPVSAPLNSSERHGIFKCHNLKGAFRPDSVHFKFGAYVSAVGPAADPWPGPVRVTHRDCSDCAASDRGSRAAAAAAATGSQAQRPDLAPAAGPHPPPRATGHHDASARHVCVRTLLTDKLLLSPPSTPGPPGPRLSVLNIAYHG